MKNSIALSLSTALLASCGASTDTKCTQSNRRPPSCAVSANPPPALTTHPTSSNTPSGLPRGPETSGHHDAPPTTGTPGPAATPAPSLATTSTPSPATTLAPSPATTSAPSPAATPTNPPPLTPPVPPVTPTPGLKPGSGLQYSQVSAQQMTLSWGAAKSAAHGLSLAPVLPVVSYKLVCLASQTSADVNTVEALNLITTAQAGLVMDWTIGMTSVELTGLQPATNYTCNVAARDDAGNEIVYQPASQATLAASAQGSRDKDGKDVAKP